MTGTDHYDVVVIGTGQGGKPLAAAFADAGHRTAIVERGRVGGTCVVVGCTPTKTMVASARVVYLARRSGDYGVHTGTVRVDQSVVRRRKRDIVDAFSGGSQRGLERHDHLDLVFGEARFTSARSLNIDLRDGGRREVTADRIIIDAGARPTVLDVPGLDEVGALDSTTIMELDAVPEHLIVLGGGFVGLEFGQMFRRFGSRVTIVDRHRRLARREDEDMADAIAGILTEDGIDLALGWVPTSAGRAGSTIRVTMVSAGEERVLEGTHVLVAAGRTPNTDRLDPGAAGIVVDDRGFVPVNERLETNVPGIWAIGDINGGPAFTHIAYDDYRILKGNLLEGKSLSTAGRLVPYVVYIDPQYGRVGLSEREAAEQGRAVEVATMPMSHVARALETDEPRGLIKAIVDRDSQQILGCAVLGVEGGEIMSMMEIAMMGGTPWPVLRDGIFAHPAFAECLNNLFGRL